MDRKTPKTRRLALGLGLLVAVAAIAAGAFALLKDDAEEAAPIAGGEPLGGGAASDCLAFDQATLLAQEIAFDGTLVSASPDGEQATFEVHGWYRGGEGTTITLGSNGLLGEEAQALVGTSLEVGQRYLISSTDGVVWACGYSLTYDTEIASEWAELFAA
jgi:hypothetical protein